MATLQNKGKRRLSHALYVTFPCAWLRCVKVYNEMLRLPVRLPTFMDKITVGVYKFDPSGYDALIADTSFSLYDLVNEGERAPHWINLNGVEGTEDLQGVREHLDRSASVLETSYKGRLLMALTMEEVPR